MAPWLQSTLVYGFVGASLALGLLARLRGHNRGHRPSWQTRVGPGLALAAPFALELGGPGALICAISALLGGYAMQTRVSGPKASRFSRAGWLAFVLSSLVFSALLSVVAGQQGLSLLRDLVPDLRVGTESLQALLLLFLAGVLLLPHKLLARYEHRLTTLVAIGWCALCGIALFWRLDQIGPALQAAFTQLRDAASFVGLAHQESQAALAAFLAMASAGIVAAYWAHDSSSINEGEESDKSSRSFPLLGILSFALTGLMLLSYGVPLHERLDDPTLRAKPDDALDLDAATARVTPLAAQDTPHQPPRWMALERPHAHSFAATSVGQSVVLPKDSPLKSDKEYRLLFRANPRGSRIGKLTPRGNGLFISYPWRTLHEIKFIRFRDKDPKRSKDGAWDLRIPVQVTRLGSDRSPRGVVLVPKNPKLILEKLSESMDGPFVELSDQTIIASPQRMHNNKLGVHDALLGYRSHPENTFAPGLRELVATLGFRGPYLSGKADEHAPFVMVGKEGLDPSTQPQRELVLRTPSRGLKVGQLGVDGSLVTPPWEHLQESKALVFRHKLDPHRDLVIPASGRLRGGRLHFFPDSSTFNDLRKLSRNPDYTGPYLLAPDYTFVVELHGGARLPDTADTPAAERGMTTGKLAERASLVPVHTIPEPVGGATKIYRPHPAELAFTDALGPYLPADPAGWLMRSLGEAPGPLRWPLRWLGRLLLLALLGLGVTKLARRLSAGMRSLLGEGAGRLGPAIAWFLAALGTLASWASLSQALMLSATILFLSQLLCTLGSLRSKS